MLVSSLELRRLHTDEHTKDSKSSELGCVLLAAVCITEWPSATGCPAIWVRILLPCPQIDGVSEGA